MHALIENIESLAEDIAQQEIDIGLRKKNVRPLRKRYSHGPLGGL